MEDDEEEGEEEGEEEYDEEPLNYEEGLSFDQEESKVGSVINRDSAGLQNDDNELINTSVDEARSEGSSSMLDETPRAGMTIEMVDLKKKSNQPKGEFVMKEFEVPNKVNQTAKKREKRKVKKEKEKELQAILDQRKLEQKQAQLREKYIELSSMESDRKPLKKKVLPKKKIADAGGDWEVVDKKQQVYVEASGDDNESLSD